MRLAALFERNLKFVDEIRFGFSALRFSVISADSRRRANKLVSDVLRAKSRGKTIRDRNRGISKFQHSLMQFFRIHFSFISSQPLDAKPPKLFIPPFAIFLLPFAMSFAVAAEVPRI